MDIYEGLIGYWNFKNGSGTTFVNKDNSSTYSGTVNETYTTWTEDGIETDNSDNRDKVKVPTTSSDFNSGDLTIVCKFIPKTLTGDYILCRYVWRFFRSGTNNISWVCGRMNNSTGPARGVTSTGNELQIGKEITMCGLYHPDSVGGNGYIQFYINGSYIGQTNIGTEIMWTEYGATAGVRWGTSKHGTWTPFEAEHLQTRIYNRILTANEINTLSKSVGLSQ